MDTAQARPEFSVGGILRDWGEEYRRTHTVTTGETRAMEALAACRTAVLGGHLEQCEGCGFERPVHNSCGNRHCPQCQGKLARRWLKRQMADLLPVPYFHVVFTVPSALDVLVVGNRRLFYGLLFRVVSRALRPLEKRHLDGEPGVVSVLHTWGQTLWLHSHVHCVVTGGALSRDGDRWCVMAPDAAPRPAPLHVPGSRTRRGTGEARLTGEFHPSGLLPDPSRESIPNPLRPRRPHRGFPGPLRRGPEVATFTP